MLGPVLFFRPALFTPLSFRVVVTIMAVQFFVLPTFNLRQRNSRAHFLLKVVFTQSCLGAKQVGAKLVCQTVTNIFLDTACQSDSFKQPKIRARLSVHFIHKAILRDEEKSRVEDDFKSQFNYEEISSRLARQLGLTVRISAERLLVKCC